MKNPPYPRNFKINYNGRFLCLKDKILNLLMKKATIAMIRTRPMIAPTTGPKPISDFCSTEPLKEKKYVLISPIFLIKNALGLIFVLIFPVFPECTFSPRHLINTMRQC